MASQRATWILFGLFLLSSSTPLIAHNSIAENIDESPNFISPVDNDRFSAGWKDSQYTDSSNRDIDIRLYYPAQDSGEDTTMDCAWAPYPVIVFHGDDGENLDDYSWIGSRLSSAGYFAVIIGEERAATRAFQAVNDHLALTEAIGYINLTGDDSRGPRGSQGCIDLDHWGVSGHGRGAALGLVVYNNYAGMLGEFFQPPRALFGLGLDTDDIGTEVEGRNLPTPNHALFLTGTSDDVAPISDHVQPLLQQWNGGWQLLEVVGANHVQYEDDQSFIDNLFDGDATMTELEQQDHAFSKVKPYLDLVLKGDDNSWYAGSSRENYPDPPADPDSYLSENLGPNQFYRMALEETTTDAPVARVHPALFFDNISKQTILTAGSGTNDETQKSWNIDLMGSGKWVDGGAGPSPLTSTSFASDGDSSGLLFGGSDIGNPTLWKWNGYSSTWTSYPNGIRPSGDMLNSMVWHDGDQRFLSYGGYNSTNYLGSNATWSFDPASAIWSELNTTNVPRSTYDGAMFYAEDWNRTILFGGVDIEGNMSNETWMLNGETLTWSKLSLSGNTPSARQSMGITTDPDDNFAYIFGGWMTDDESGATYAGSELWRLDLQALTWEQLASPGINPLTNPGLSFDRTTDELILFGGQTTFGIYSDQTWTYNFTEGEWDLHASSSAITSNDAIEFSANVSERDLESPPSNLETKCRISGNVDWLDGSWDSSENSATCSLSPLGISPGLHEAEMMVIHDDKRATISITFDRANAPPTLHDPMPIFSLYEEGEIEINATAIASDIDGHTLRFTNTPITSSVKYENQPLPDLDWTLRNDRQTLWISDLADWSGRTSPSTYEICGEIRDQSSGGNPPAVTPFCFDLAHIPIDDPFIISENPTFTFEEDETAREIDLSSYLSDEEGEEPVLWIDATGSILSEDKIEISAVEEFGNPTAKIEVKPNPHWNGLTQSSLCMIKSDLPAAEKIANNCAWLNITVEVSPLPDMPIFNMTQFSFDEDTVFDVPLSDIVWDPDGDLVNLTVEQGESNLSVEVWHEFLRFIPEENWNGRAVSFALNANDGNLSRRQPILITVDNVDDETIVSWTTPPDVVNNLTSLRVDIQDVDSEGPWLIEYKWDSTQWKEITPSCSSTIEGYYECQADLLATSLSFGDHKLNLRVNDGDSTSEVMSYWLTKADPDANANPTTSETAGLTGIAFIIGGLVLLVAAGATIFTLQRRID